MRLVIAILGIGLLVSACSPGSQNGTPTTTTLAATTTSRALSNEICTAGDLPFGDSGLVAVLGEDSGDASSLSEIRWDPASDCERLTISFGAGSGAPATTLGPIGVTVIPYAGVVRIGLPPELIETSVADSLLEGDLVDSVYAFRNGERLTIDIHAVDGIPIATRAFTTTSPASLVVDIVRAGTEAVPVGVTTTNTAVVINPTPGPGSYPIVVEGYAAPGLTSLHVQLNQDGDLLVDRSVALKGDAGAWQFFTSTIDDGPIGAVALFVGTVDGDGIRDTGALVSVNVE